MTTLLSRKGIILVGIPLFTIFLQAFIRFILCKDFNTIGITLGSLGLGQIFPFIYFDHFIANKILGISPTYTFGDGNLTISYSLNSSVNPQQINQLKDLFYVAILLNFALFMITIWLGINDRIIPHIIFGAANCFVSWYLLIFK